MIPWRFSGGLLALLMISWSGSSPAAGRMDLIEQRGVLVVGVKGDYPPFGMRDDAGRLVGLEVDLARDLADRLGVELRLVPVSSATRLNKLQDGEVDLLIATLGDTAQRREVAALIEPNYYESGMNVLVPAAAGITAWTQLRGRTLCASQGALYNNQVERRYLINLDVYNGNRDAKLAARSGSCLGWLYDDVAILATLAEPGWDDYQMPLRSILSTPWAMAVARDERGGELEWFLGDTIAEWHRTGFLIDIANRFGMHLPFLDEQQEIFSRRDANGELFCRRDGDRQWPRACRNQQLLDLSELGSMHAFGYHLKAATGLDVSLLYDPFERMQMVQGLLLTLLLVALTVPGSLLIGWIGALILSARIPVVSHLVAVLAGLARMTPPLLQMYLVFFGIGGVVAVRYGLAFDALIVSSLVLSFYAGAANAHLLAAGLDEVRRRSPGAPLNLEMTRKAFVWAYGGVMASSVNVVKATGLASTLAVPELINATTGIVADHGNSDVMMNLLMVVYFIIVLIVVWSFERAYRRYARQS